MRLVDSHHHLWNLDKLYYPWLTDQLRTVSYGDYSAIRKSYLLDDWRRDVGDLNVVKSVHVQADHDPRNPVAETQWLQHLADSAGSSGFPHAIVCYIDLSQSNALDMLSRHLQYSNVRGVRQMLHAGPAMSYLRDETWRRNLNALSSHTLTFDLQILPSQSIAAAEVIACNPDLNFILDHAGCPTQSALQDRSWQAAIARLSQLPNLSAKLSGFGMFDREWTSDSIRLLVLHMLSCFGVHRCMFGSNFPVDSMMKAYRSLWEA